MNSREARSLIGIGLGGGRPGRVAPLILGRAGSASGRSRTPWHDRNPRPGRRRTRMGPRRAVHLQCRGWRSAWRPPALPPQDVPAVTVHSETQAPDALGLAIVAEREARAGSLAGEPLRADLLQNRVPAHGPLLRRQAAERPRDRIDALAALVDPGRRTARRGLARRRKPRRCPAARTGANDFVSTSNRPRASCGGRRDRIMKVARCQLPPASSRQRKSRARSGRSAKSDQSRRWPAPIRAPGSSGRRRRVSAAMSDPDASAGG